MTGRSRLRRSEAPTDVVLADADAIRTAHIMEFSATRGGQKGRRFGWFWKACSPACHFAGPHALQQ